MPNVDTTAPITAPTVDPTGRPTTGTKPAKERGPMDFDALGAKAYQALTFGFGATLDKAIFGKQAEQTTRQLVKDYDHDNPLSSAGIDLAAATIQTAAAPGSGTTGIAGAVGRIATSGAGIGALQGAGAEGSLSDRAVGAAKGAAVGGVVGGAVGYLGKVARPALEKTGILDAAKSAFDKVQAALKSEGKSMDDLQNFLKANPGARAADFSPKVAEAVSKAGGVTNKTSDALGTATRADAAGQTGRIAGGVGQAQPLDKIRQQMIDDLGDISSNMKSKYTQSKAEIMPVSPELQKVLEHPEVAPLHAKALKDYQAARQAGVSDVQNTPKYKAGSELPSAVLDETQKAVGNAAQEEGVGTIRRGTLDAAQRALKGHQTGSIKEAQGLAARLGGADSGTGVLGAQEFGHGFAFGLKKSDAAAWDKIKGDPEKVQYARLGMLNGLDEYLTNAGRMGEAGLTKIADKMRDPKVVEVLGQKGASSVRKVFSDEAARQRVSATMEKGGNRQAAFHEENESRMAAHAANVVGGFGHVVGTTVRFLTGTGMSEKQALNIIKMAAEPGGMAKVKAMGAPKKVIEALYAQRSGIAGGMAASTDIKGQR